MYRIILLVCLYLLGWKPAIAQNQELIRVGADEDIAKAIPASQRYRFEHFRQGTVSFYNGTQASAPLNYNLLLEELQFINLTRDTMAIADEQLVKQVNIGEDKFYYSEQSGFVEMIADYSPVKLAIHQKFTTINAEKMGAYEQSSAVSSISTYSSFTSSSGQRQNLKLRGDVVLAIESTFYLIDQNYRIYKANKSALKKIFPENKDNLKDYIEQESIDFNNIEDLKKLLQYCSELDS